MSFHTNGYSYFLLWWETLLCLCYMCAAHCPAPWLPRAGSVLLHWQYWTFPWGFGLCLFKPQDQKLVSVCIFLCLLSSQVFCKGYRKSDSFYAMCLFHNKYSQSFLPVKTAFDFNSEIQKTVLRAQSFTQNLIIRKKA